MKYSEYLEELVALLKEETPNINEANKLLAKAFNDAELMIDPEVRVNEFEDLYDLFSEQVDIFSGLSGFEKFSDPVDHYTWFAETEKDPETGEEVKRWKQRKLSRALAESDLPGHWAQYKSLCNCVHTALAAFSDAVTAGDSAAAFSAPLWRALKKDVEAACLLIKQAFGADFFVRVNNATAWKLCLTCFKRVKTLGDSQYSLELKSRAQVRAAVEELARNMLFRQEEKISSRLEKAEKEGYIKAANAAYKAEQAEKKAAKAARKEAEKKAREKNPAPAEKPAA